MRTLIIEIETDSNASLKELRKDLQQEIGSCTHYFDTDNMSVQDKPEGMIIILPVPVGTTVYKVIPPCREGMTYCPYSGGYGTRRCDGEKHCGAYIEEVSYSVNMYRDKSIYIDREKAEKRCEKLNKRR